MSPRCSAIVAGAIFFFVPTVALAASDLVITLQGPGEAPRGQTVQYTMMVANNGPDEAPQVRLQGSVPYDFLWEPAFSDSRCNAPYGSLSCDLGLLPAGTVTNLTLAFTIRPPASASSCYPLTTDVSVSLSFGGTDHVFGNNTASVRTLVPCPPPVECNDGIDNDRDGALDYSAYSWGNGDFGCSSPTDRDERYPEAVCQDGRDNDGDGLIDFPLDPGCSSRQDNDEFHPLPPAPPAPQPPPQFPPPLSPPPPPSPTPPPQSPPQFHASLVPQGTMPWLALPIPRCYNNVGAGWVEDIMIDIRCEGSKWSSGSLDGSGGGGSGLGGRSGRGGTGGGQRKGGGSGGGGGAESCTGNGRATIERTSDQREALPGSIVRYVIMVRNTSERCPLLNLVLRNRLPSGTIVLDAGGGVFDGHELRWHIPRIDPGVARRISYSVRVPRSFSGDRFGGELSVDGTDGRIGDDGSIHVLRRFPKTGVDAAAMTATFWMLLAGGGFGLGGVLGWRLFSSH